jgi:Mlc titration factor MtfA (ptsG expression regulator)
MYWGVGLILALGAALAAWFWWRPSWVALRRARIRRRPFPAEWRKVLREQVPAVARLPANLQLKLKGDAMRVVVAAQACLLQLGRRNHFFPTLTQVLLYPNAFIVQRTEAAGAGLQRDVQRVLSGESWGQGQVILSWEDVLAGAADPGDGHNVVVHEFAHQLDQEKGAANGAPPLPRRASRALWAQVLGQAFERLRTQVLRGGQDGEGEGPLIDAYGATDPAEFFAVACEVFFERPEALAQAEPALFEQLCICHRVNPLSWR